MDEMENVFVHDWYFKLEPWGVAFAVLAIVVSAPAVTAGLYVLRR
jgi:hypothetical protein